jgi:RHS repeat-associated protein
MDQLVRLDNRSEGRSFFHLDGLRSTVSLTDGTGGSRQSIFYDAWGNERDRVGVSANNYTFTGHELDVETGLIYAKARFYDAEVGRFFHQDTELGETNVPPSLHRYTYAFQNPLRFIDPNGRQSLAATAEEEKRRRAAVAEARASGVLPPEGLKAETAGLGGQVFTEEAQVPDRPDQFMHDADTQRELGRIAQAVEAERERARQETVISEEQALMDTVNDPALTALLFQRRDTARAIRNVGAVGSVVGETYIVVAAGTVGDIVILATGKDLNEREASRWLAVGAIILVGVSAAEIQALNRADDQVRATGEAGQHVAKSPAAARAMGKLWRYSEVLDPRTSRKIPFPTGNLQHVPIDKRIAWGANERYEFIREWHRRGYPTPRGGWDKYDVHHIHPRELGGGNDFWNLVPVERGTHQKMFNEFWRTFLE